MISLFNKTRWSTEILVGSQHYWEHLLNVVQSQISMWDMYGTFLHMWTMKAYINQNFHWLFIVSGYYSNLT